MLLSFIAPWALKQKQAAWSFLESQTSIFVFNERIQLRHQYTYSIKNEFFVYLKHTVQIMDINVMSIVKIPPVNTDNTGGV